MMRNETFKADPEGRAVCVSAEIIDLNAGTLAFEVNGVVTSSRALTADEVVRYTPTAPPPDPASQLAAARSALAPLEQVAAPYTTADIVDVLLDVKTALGG